MKERNFEIFLNEYQALKARKQPFVVVTLVGIEGSSPQNLGARCLVDHSGLVWGTVGGGKIEAHAIRVAQEMLKTQKGEPESFRWNLQKDIGMTCGGLVSFFFEPILVAANWSVAVFGAGHVGQEVVRLLTNLDCDIRVVDSRPEWLEKIPNTQKIHKIFKSEMKEALQEIPSQSFVVIMTMGHGTDLPILTEAMKSHDFPYVGNMGSDQKAKVLQRDLTEAGVSPKAISRLHCPIGESFGNNSPVEIAFSVVAQLLRVRDKR